MKNKNRIYNNLSVIGSNIITIVTPWWRVLFLEHALRLGMHRYHHRYQMQRSLHLVSATRKTAPIQPPDNTYATSCDVEVPVNPKRFLIFLKRGYLSYTIVNILIYAIL